MGVQSEGTVAEGREVVGVLAELLAREAAGAEEARGALDREAGGLHRLCCDGPSVAAGRCHH